MRQLCIALGLAIPLLAGSIGPGRADSARWCAQFGGRDGGGTECLYHSYAQCMATLSGMGGRCFQNSYWDGRRSTTERRSRDYR